MIKWKERLENKNVILCPDAQIIILLKDKPILTYIYIVVLKIVKNKQHYVGNE